MIRRLAAAIAMLIGAAAQAQDDPEILSAHRMDIPELIEHTIGEAAQSVGFDWRDTTIQLAPVFGLPIELNSFAALRGGLTARRPIGDALFELTISRRLTWNTNASRALATTPYRQAGRMSHVTLDIGVSVPIAEGVVTTRTRLIASAQMALTVYGGLRYRYFPGAMAGKSPSRVLGALFQPGLTESEVQRLAAHPRRPESMQVDPSRYDLMVGIGNDVYLRTGFFVSPRVNISLPLIAPLSGTELVLWADVSLAVGWAL